MKNKLLLIVIATSSSFALQALTTAEVKILVERGQYGCVLNMLEFVPAPERLKVVEDVIVRWDSPDVSIIDASLRHLSSSEKATVQDKLAQKKSSIPAAPPMEVPPAPPMAPPISTPTKPVAKPGMPSAEELQKAKLRKAEGQQKAPAGSADLLKEMQERGRGGLRPTTPPAERKKVEEKPMTELERRIAERRKKMEQQ